MKILNAKFNNTNLKKQIFKAIVNSYIYYKTCIDSLIYIVGDIMTEIVLQGKLIDLKTAVEEAVEDINKAFEGVWNVEIFTEKGKDKVPETALRMAEAGAWNILEFGVDDVMNSEFLLILTRGLIKSGFAMCIVGSSRPASGSEHKICHSIDHLYALRKNLHGEQTGVATLFSMAVQEHPLLSKVKTLYENIEFPLQVKKLYLDNDQFTKAVLNAPSFHPDRYTILEDRNLSEPEIKTILKEHQL